MIEEEVSLYGGPSRQIQDDDSDDKDTMQVNNNAHRSLAGLQQKDQMTSVKKPTKNEEQLIEFE